MAEALFKEEASRGEVDEEALALLLLLLLLRLTTFSPCSSGSPQVARREDLLEACRRFRQIRGRGIFFIEIWQPCWLFFLSIHSYVVFAKFSSALQLIFKSLLANNLGGKDSFPCHKIIFSNAYQHGKYH